MDGNPHDLDLTRRCLHCHASLPETKRAHAEYCSRTCSKAAYVVIEKQGRLDDKRNRPPCQCCGKPIPVEARKGQVFCSLLCQRRARRRRNQIPKTCVVCGVGFMADWEKQRCCSHACAMEARRLDQPRVCGCCGTVIARPVREQLYCSPRCTLKVSRARKKAARASVLSGAEGGAVAVPDHGRHVVEE